MHIVTRPTMLTLTVDRMLSNSTSHHHHSHRLASSSSSSLSPNDTNNSSDSSSQSLLSFSPPRKLSPSTSPTSHFSKIALLISKDNETDIFCSNTSDKSSAHNNSPCSNRADDTFGEDRPSLNSNHVKKEIVECCESGSDGNTVEANEIDHGPTGSINSSIQVKDAGRITNHIENKEERDDEVASSISERGITSLNHRIERARVKIEEEHDDNGLSRLYQGITVIGGNPLLLTPPIFCGDVGDEDRPPSSISSCSSNTATTWISNSWSPNAGLHNSIMNGFTGVNHINSSSSSNSSIRSSLKFSIHDILKPDFGQRAITENGQRSQQQSQSKQHNHHPNSTIPIVKRKVSRGPSSVKTHSEDSNSSCSSTRRSEEIVDETKVNPEVPEGPLLWPAWVYCTRYSDRPSSGPRSRRVRKKSEDPRDRSDGTCSSSTASLGGPSDEKRPRTAFTAEQLGKLKQEFDENRYLTEKRRQDLARDLKLHENQIKIWFQNKRAKLKKSSGQRGGLALQLMAQGLYNHSTVPMDEDEEYLA